MNEITGEMTVLALILAIILIRQSNIIRTLKNKLRSTTIDKDSRIGILNKKLDDLNKEFDTTYRSQSKTIYELRESNNKYAYKVQELSSQNKELTVSNKLPNKSVLEEEIKNLKEHINSTRTAYNKGYAKSQKTIREQLSNIRGLERDKEELTKSTEILRERISTDKAIYNLHQKDIRGHLSTIKVLEEDKEKLIQSLESKDKEIKSLKNPQ